MNTIQTTPPEHILHVIAINGIGGAEKLLLDLLPALQEKQVRVSCLIFYKPATRIHAESIGKELAANGIEVHYISYESAMLGNKKELLAFLAGRKFSIIHSHLKHTDFWLARLKFKGILKTPVVTTMHGYRDKFHGRYGLKWKSGQLLTSYYWLSKFISRNVDGLIMISKGIDKLYRDAHLGNKNSVIIYHGTTLDKMNPVKETLSKVPKLVLAGRLTGFKGHIYAIKAVKILENEFPELQLHFFGTGPEESNLKEAVRVNQLEEKVIFHGFVNNLATRMPEHDIAVVPSIGEPFGLVFFDSFKAGLPVVAFDVPAGNEIITHGRNGLLAETENAASLAEKLRQLLTDNELRKKLVKNSQEVLASDFSLDRMAADYLSFYRKTINADK